MLIYGNIRVGVGFHCTFASWETAQWPSQDTFRKSELSTASLSMAFVGRLWQIQILFSLVRLFEDFESMPATISDSYNAILATKMEREMIDMLPSRTIRDCEGFRLLPLGPLRLKLR